MSSSPDLTLPPTFPRLGGYGRYSWSNSSFALYSLLSTDQQHLENIAATLDAEWFAEQGYEGSHLVRVAPSPSHNSLTDILDTHAELHKVAPGQSEDQYGAMDLEWYPCALIVITGEELDEKGLLFVFVDDGLDDEVEEEEEEEEDRDEEKVRFATDKFFFKTKDAHSMLSSLMYDDESCARSKEMYGY